MICNWCCCRIKRNRFQWHNKVINYFLWSRKDEAVNRPKLEFVPKTLADLQIEGINDLNHGRRYGSTCSLPRPRQRLPPSSSVGDLSTSDPLKAWDAHAPQRPRAQYTPHPAPRAHLNGKDPWTGDSGFICWVFLCSVLVMDCNL